MLRLAEKTAITSTFPRARVGAVIANKNIVISIGVNKVRYFKDCPTSKKFENSLHAEQAAIMKILRTGQGNKLRNTTIFVCRVNKHGKCRLAKPCSHCLDLIKFVGIKRIVYSTDTLPVRELVRSQS